MTIDLTGVEVFDVVHSGEQRRLSLSCQLTTGQVQLDDVPDKQQCNSGFHFISLDRTMWLKIKSFDNNKPKNINMWSQNSEMAKLFYKFYRCEYRTIKTSFVKTFHFKYDNLAHKPSVVVCNVRCVI